MSARNKLIDEPVGDKPIDAPTRAFVDALLGERSAICDANDKQIENAWKEPNSEFGNALCMAYMAGETKLLKDYVAAGKPVPQARVFVAGESTPIQVLVACLLGDHRRQQEQGSRRHRVASEAPAAQQAERNAAWLVAFGQKAWRERNRRKRVPSFETNRMIAAAIEEAAKTFRVPVSTIYESNIRIVLKNRRVFVR